MTDTTSNTAQNATVTILMGTRGCVRLGEGKVDTVAFWAVRSDL